MPEIWNAIKRLSERKDAIAVGQVGENVGSDGQRQLMVGMDIDIAELHQARIQAVEGVGRTMLAKDLTLETMGADEFGALIAGMWVDGLMTGVLLQEAREK